MVDSQVYIRELVFNSCSTDSQVHPKCCDKVNVFGVKMVTVCISSCEHVRFL